MDIIRGIWDFFFVIIISVLKFYIERYTLSILLSVFLIWFFNILFDLKKYISIIKSASKPPSLASKSHVSLYHIFIIGWLGYLIKSDRSFGKSDLYSGSGGDITLMLLDWWWTVFLICCDIYHIFVNGAVILTSAAFPFVQGCFLRVP